MASKATKEVKLIKEELRTCQLDREYHKDVADKKTALVDTLQKDLQAQVDRCSELIKENAEKTQLLEEQTDEILNYKDSVDVCFYMFWKHNRNADFSYLGDAYAAEEAKCLKRLAEEEADAAAGGSQDRQDPEAWSCIFYFFLFSSSVVCEQHYFCKDNLVAFEQLYLYWYNVLLSYC